MKSNDMWSVTKTSYMWLSKPARKQVSYKKFSCDDKNCQSTKSIKCVHDDQKCQSTVCSDKNCQETMLIHMQPLKSEKIKYYAVTQTKCTIPVQEVM